MKTRYTEKIACQRLGNIELVYGPNRNNTAIEPLAQICELGDMQSPLDGCNV